MNSFKNKITYKLFANKSNIYKQDLALNNPQGLIIHKSTSQPTSITLKWKELYKINDFELMWSETSWIASKGIIITAMTGLQT